MKKIKRILCILLTLCICFASVNIQKAQAANLYKYNKTDKLYNVKKKYKGYELRWKNSYNYFRIVKMSKNKITLQAQITWRDSDDPVFGGKKKTYKLASNCKFYYTDVSFPGKVSGDDYIRYYKRIPKSAVQKDGFHGAVYIKKGKIIAMACHGGD